MKLFGLVVFLLTAVSRSIGSDWPQLQRDPQRTGYTPDNIGSSNRTVRWRWNVDQSTAVKIHPMVQPIVAAGKVFIGDLEGNMSALNATTGVRVWRYGAEQGILHAAAYDDGKIYFTSQDSYIYCVNANSGELVWRYKTGAGIWTAPLVVANTCYVTSRDKKLYALNADTGRLQWTFSTGGPILNSPAYSATFNVVVFGSEDMYVYCINLDGTQKWRTRVPGQSFRNFWPVVADKHGLVILRTMPITFHDSLGKEGTFHVLSLSNGAVQTAYNSLVLFTQGSGGTPVAPVIDPTGDAMYVVTRGAYMANAFLGKITMPEAVKSWETEAPGGGSGIRLIGDEGCGLSMAGGKILISMVQCVGAVTAVQNLSPYFGIIHERSPARDGFWFDSDLAIFYAPEIAIYSSESPNGHIAPGWGPAVVSDTMVLWISDGSGVVAVDCR